MKISYHLEQSFIKAEFIRAGIQHNHRQDLDIDPATLTPAQRELLLTIGSMDYVTLTLPRWTWNGMERVNWDAPRQYPNVAALMADWEAIYHDALMVALAARDEAVAAEIAKLEAYTPDATLLSFGKGEPQFKTMFAFHPDYRPAFDGAKARYDAARAEAAEKAQDAARAEAAEKARREAEKREWCAGPLASDHLRAAVAAGYDCQRLYVTERAAAEFPNYVVDFDDNAAWRDRSCPSPEALAEAARVNGRVVWLTRRPVDDEFGTTDDNAEEAVVIREYLGKYDLVRVM